MQSFEAASCETHPAPLRRNSKTIKPWSIFQLARISLKHHMKKRGLYEAAKPK
jgi:hypothetical protein